MAAKSNLTNMLVVLTGTCLICSALLAGIYSVTAEPIAQTNKNILMESISAVVPDGVEISDAKTFTVGGKDSEYYECTKDGSVVAYAIKSESAGFGGPLTLMVGITTDGVVYNASVLSHSETPGLGANCTSDEDFKAQWKGFDPSSKILAVKKDGGDVDAITASTITSRAYTLAVKNAVEAFKTIKGE
jgi:electron transport complex protein RnfG